MSRLTIQIVIASVALLSVLVVGAARAGDGVFEINMACATSGAGCFPGDTGGFPVTVTQSGSYRLTGNLNVTENQTAILIQADDVSIDLAGFAILGPNTCSFTGSAFVCTSPGVGRGITRGNALINGTTVRNGVIRGMGQFGIFLWARARVQDVTVEDNGASGLLVSQNSIVERSISRLNANHGVAMGDSSIAANCVISDNFGVGISFGGQGTVLGSNISNNRGGGIVSGGGVITDNVVKDNGASTSAPAIFLFGWGVVRSNDVSFNRGPGISIDAAAVLADNQVTNNGGCGAELGAVSGQASTLGGNVFVGNNTANTCNGNNFGNQKQIRGVAFASTCNVTTCSNASLTLPGSFCPPNTPSCPP